MRADAILSSLGCLMRINQQALRPRAARIALLIVTAFGIGCGDVPITNTPTLAAPAVSRATRTVPFDAFGIASQFPPGGSPCSAPEYRQFDFWLGKWDARRTDTNALSGTDVITSELGGCVVEENWNDGFRGRSMSVYDASIRQWTQFWVYTGGGAFSPLLLQGGFTDGEMAMRYDRTSTAGVFIPFPPPGGLRFQISDAYEWIPDPQTGSVFQRDRRSFDGAAPFVAFVLRYDRVADVTPIPTSTAGSCVSRAQNHQFDFMIGDWNIYAGRGTPNGAPQGRATFSSDLGACLIEEHNSETPDYRGWSFNSWSIVTQQWHRTYVDNDGHRIALTGGLAGKAMVMTGTQSSPSGPVTVRVTWDPRSSAQVLQTWEVSRDGGATWPMRREFTYAKQ